MSNPSQSPALLDANILVYAAQEDAPQHKAATVLREQALTGAISACVCPQVLNEFFVGITRTDKRAVQHPVSSEQAVQEVRKYCESDHLLLIHPGSRIMERMLTLLDQHPLTGLRLHDVHLVATMLENDITQIYTYDTRHFSIFSEIEVLTPPDPEPKSEPSPKSNHPMTGDHTD